MQITAVAPATVAVRQHPVAELLISATQRIEQAPGLRGPVFGRVVNAARTDVLRAVDLLQATDESPAALAHARIAAKWLADALLVGQPSVALGIAGREVQFALDALAAVPLA